MNKAQIAKMIDHTILKAEATESEIIKLCKEAIHYDFASVCVNPSMVPVAAKELKGTHVKVCTVIGFPLGATTTEVKVFETKDVIEKGATEVDMVINVGKLKERDLEYVKNDIKAVVEAAKDKALTKVIIETCLLTDEEKVDVARSAEIYKFDLLTGMVGEFDELQGVMGEKYALLAGENANVAAAIREHYMPTSADGQLPETKVGSVLAAADKIDSVLSFFNVGLIPSGSNDPYALRRAVQGLIRIIEKMNWHFDLSLFIDQFEGQNHAEILEFVKARVQKLLLEKLDRYDIVEAAINSSNFDITNMMESAFVIDGHKLHEPFKPAIENVSRSINLVKKAADIAEINPALFEEDTEQALYDAVISLQNQWTYKPCEEKFRAIVHTLAPAIEAFFDNVMVMAEDLAVRDNRIALLSEVVALTSVMADFSLINTK